MRAANLVSKLLEDGADPEDGADLKDEMPSVSEFDLAALPVVREANSLYAKLKNSGSLDALFKQYPNMDETAVAIAVLKMTTERSGSLGADRVYKWFKRHAPYI